MTHFSVHTAHAWKLSCKNSFINTSHGVLVPPTYTEDAVFLGKAQSTQITV